MSPCERKFVTLYQKKKHIPKTTYLLNSIESGLFDSEKCEAIQLLKQYMHEENKWKEVSKAKNPNKDKNYQLTIKVLELLKNCM